MTPKQELDLILKKQEIVTATIAVDLKAELTLISPVGNKNEWKNPENAPDGYAGGMLRKSWTLEKSDKSTWTIDNKMRLDVNNNLYYAERRLMPLSPDGYYGSKQFPLGAGGVIEKYERKLQSEMNKI